MQLSVPLNVTLMLLPKNSCLSLWTKYHFLPAQSKPQKVSTYQLAKNMCARQGSKYCDPRQSLRQRCWQVCWISRLDRQLTTPAFIRCSMLHDYRCNVVPSAHYGRITTLKIRNADIARGPLKTWLLWELWCLMSRWIVNWCSFFQRGRSLKYLGLLPSK